MVALPLTAFDCETYQIQDGLLAPPLVCGSAAEPEPGTERILSREEAVAEFERLLRESGRIIVGANIAYDMAVLMVAAPHLIPLVIEKYDREEVYDVLIAQGLNDIANGTFLLDPKTRFPLKHPDTGKRAERYSLELTSSLALGRHNAKENDAYRLRYGELASIPMSQWPAVAIQYPKDDARNTVDVARAQIEQGYKNLGHLTREVRAALGMHLGAVHGLRTDPVRVAELQKKTADQCAAYQQEFQAVGFLRPGGSEDTAKVKSRVARAYGATNPCGKCAGTGKVPSPKTGKPIQCKACSATGLEIPPNAPRTETGGLRADRDSLSESGDEVLERYAAVSRAEKIRDTYLPFLWKGTNKPICPNTNSLLETCRASYRSLVQLIPRDGGVRECFVARPGTVWCSVDYGALELSTLAQVCLWKVGYSRMAERINADEDLHLSFAADMNNIPYAELKSRYEAKDPAVKSMRQLTKCFHPDTEVLTRRGWVRVGEVTYEDEVASADPSAGAQDIKIEWQKPTALTQRHAEELVHLQNEGINLRVTPDHRMLAFNGKGEPTVTTPDEFGKKRYWASAGKLETGSREVEPRLLQLAVAAQADGNFQGRRIRFGFTKIRKVARLLSLLRPGEFNQWEYQPKSPNANKVFSIRFSRKLSDDVRSLLTPNKTMPWWWIELKPALRKLIIDEAEYWDGSVTRGGTAYQFSSVEMDNHHVLQALGALTGRKTRTRVVGKANKPEHRPCFKTTVRKGHLTRGENVVTTRVPHNNTVYCISVPSSFIVVRDGGKVVITGQCANFGFGGGMGAAKLVLAKRKEGLRFCITAKTAPLCSQCGGKPGNESCRECYGRGAVCGAEKTTVYKRREIPPTCMRCIEVAQGLRDKWFQAWPEMAAYHKWAGAQYDANPLNPTIESPGTGFIRGGLDTFSTAANHPFQHLAAVGAKTALWNVTRECYLPSLRSPLFGCRVLIFVHDELLVEMPEHKAHLAGPRLAEVMIASMRTVVPDVKVSADPALMRFWSKAAEPVYRDGRLVVWEPKDGT